MKFVNFKLLALMALLTTAHIESTYKKTQPVTPLQKSMIRKISDKLQQAHITTLLKGSVLVGAAAHPRYSLGLPLLGALYTISAIGTFVDDTDKDFSSTKKFVTSTARICLTEIAIASGLAAAALFSAKGLNSLARKWMGIKNEPAEQNADTATEESKSEETENSEVASEEEETEQII